LKLAELLNVVDFKASDGWLSSFKDRHGIVFKSVQGEAAAVNLERVEEWRHDVLRDLLIQYPPQDIFNVDETGLFWRLLPDKTMTFKGNLLNLHISTTFLGDKCSGGKRSKERITVLVGSNMDGSEKVPLLVIGKSLNPRCFGKKNNKARLPLEYTANKKAWMTG